MNRRFPQNYISGFGWRFSRYGLLYAVIILMAAVLLFRFFRLQIVEGESYLENYSLRIRRERVEEGVRGSILDRNGEPLAQNRVSYTVMMSDNENYDSTAERNSALNHTLEQVIAILEENGDAIVNDFGIRKEDDGSYSFRQEGTALQRFRADVFGHAGVEDLEYNSSLGIQEAEASADQIMEYLGSQQRFGIDRQKESAYALTVLRYAMSLNDYQRYLQIPVALDVSEKTRAAIQEREGEFPGISLEEDTVRVYEDSKYFSHITGYTGGISPQELETLSRVRDDYGRNDIVGKTGMEQVLEQELKGEKRSGVLYVDNVGRVLEEEETQPAAAGGDVELTIDAGLQKAVYDIIEQQLAGILYAKTEDRLTFEPGEGGRASDLIIPVGDVYFALLENKVLDMEHFSREEAGTGERRILAQYLEETERMIEELPEKLGAQNTRPVGEEEERWQEYLYEMENLLISAGIWREDRVDREDEVYRRWQEGSIAAEDYFRHGLEQGWMSLEQAGIEEGYLDMGEAYETLCRYLVEYAPMQEEFRLLVYRLLIQNGQIPGRELCMALLEQGAVPFEEEEYRQLEEGTLGAFSFIREKIRTLAITPAQLALDPCTGSCVILDAKTGEPLACVTYPGYDNNRLANGVDADYYNGLLQDASLPLYNNATQQRTAPGSIFKPVTAAAALTEGIVTTQTQITDRGIFTEITPSPSCWIYPGGTHGSITISEAIRDSCNYFFYEMGYRMSLENGVYQENKGTETLRQYAGLFGLGEKTGIEIDEADPRISTEYPVTSAIGQGNHNYTTVELARYAAAIASRGNIYRVSLRKDTQNRLLRHMDILDSSAWDAIWTGMEMAAEGYSSFRDFPINVAAKTGTAEQVRNRPNHALFMGFAPVEDPEIALAVRIAYGYTSSNAAQVAANVMRYYFGLEEEKELLTREAEEVEHTQNVILD